MVVANSESYLSEAAELKYSRIIIYTLFMNAYENL